MLQRIQTIWLLLAGALTLLTIKLPFYTGIPDPTLTPGVTYHQLNGLTAGILVLLLTITVSVLAFVAIALYKTRVTQLRICIAAIVLDLVIVYLFYRKITTYSQGAYSLTAILHLLIIAFFILAAKGISNDQKLVKDSDRLR